MNNISHHTIGTGKPVIFFHGYGLDHTYLKHWFEETIPFPCQRIYFDLPGMGLSQNMESDSSDKIVASCIEFLDSLALTEKALIISHSYGSYIAQAIVAKRPTLFDGILMLAPVVYPFQKDRKLGIHKVFEFDSNYFNEIQNKQTLAFKHFQDRFVVQNSDTWSYCNTFIYPLNNELLFKPNLMASVHYALSDKFNTRMDCKLINTKILVGENDQIVGYEDCQIYEGSEIEVIPQSGHYFFVERKNETASKVLAWLNLFTTEARSFTHDWKYYLRNYDIPTICKTELITPVIENTSFVGPVLDIGTGTGLYAEYISSKGLSVTAIDTDSQHFKVDSKVTYLTMSADKLTFEDNRFETILLINVLGTMNDDQTCTRVLNEIKRVKTKTGKAYVIVPSEEVYHTEVDSEVFKSKRIGPLVQLDYKKINGERLIFPDNVISQSKINFHANSAGLKILSMQSLKYPGITPAIYEFYVLQ